MGQFLRFGHAFPDSLPLALALLVSGCVSFGEMIPEQTLDSTSSPRIIRAGAPASVGLGEQATAVAPLIVRGADAPQLPAAELSGASVKDGGYLLNFDGADLHDVVKAVLGDMLGASYTIDPSLKGTITLHTAKPLAREAVIPAFEETLKASGVALIAGKSGYQVVPLAGAAQKSMLGLSGRGVDAGYQTKIIPLHFVAATDLQRALEPLVAPGTVVQGDPRATFVVLAGTTSDIERAERAISLFDVDWLRRQSFGLFPLKYSSAKEVANDLESVVGKQGPLGGGVQVTAIEHLNAILVVSRNYAQIGQMRTWIERFDRGKDILAPRMFVYHVQNGSAHDLAGVLAKVFSPSRRQSSSSGGSS